VSVTLYLDYNRGAFDSNYFNSEHFVCEDLGNPFNPEHVINVEKSRKFIPFIPVWINKNEEIVTSHNSRPVNEYNYDFKLNQYEKWIIDDALRSHRIIYLKDTVNNREGEVWIKNVAHEWSSVNYDKPWETSIILIADNIQLIN